MTRTPSLPEFHAPDQVRFQLSLIHLLYPAAGLPPQVNELENLLGDSARAIPSR